MARIVAAMAMTHSPGLTGWFTRAPEAYQQLALGATAEMRRRLEAARPDALVMFTNDHLLNWPINNIPEYAVGIGEEHVGPADWFDEWLGMEEYRVPGHPALARWIVNEGARRRLQFAWLRRMQFDDGISVPTHYLNPDARFRLVPVGMNCTVPPIPTPERAYHVGSVLRDVLHAYPGDDRIAVIATGGLSHEPGGPRYFWVDEEFDRWFLDLLAKGDHETLLAECTLERMEAAGRGRRGGGVVVGGDRGGNKTRAAPPPRRCPPRTRWIARRSTTSGITRSCRDSRSSRVTPSSSTRATPRTATTGPPRRTPMSSRGVRSEATR